MKAWILEKQARVEEKPVRLAEVPSPDVGDSEVRIRVLVCGVCRTDIHIAEGDLDLKKRPLILGHEVVGIVDRVGKGVTRFREGDRAGGYWVHRTCGTCTHCLSGRENYCSGFEATGWDADGGFCEYMTVGEDYAVRLDGISLEPADIAPLMCPGIAGYAALLLTRPAEGRKLGIYGYGPTAYFTLRIALSMGHEVYVSTRSPEHIRAAKEDGAEWAGDSSGEQMPCKLDSAIVFPPAGGFVEPALSQIRRGGVLVLAPVSSSPITIDNYSENLWGRTIDTLYNLRTSEAEEFFPIAEELGLRLDRTVYRFEELDDVLVRVKQGRVPHAAAVIRVAND
jgi:propanol-preferring alcohol dehydrogenase